VGTGPFIVNDYVKGSALTYVRNPDYWGYDEKNPTFKLPYVDKLVYLIIPDSSTTLSALRTGKIDIIAGVRSSDALALRRTNPELGQKEVVAYATNMTMRCDREPFKDNLKVRKALQMSIDLKAIAKDYYGGYADPFASILSSEMQKLGIWIPLEQYPPEVQEGFTYDPAKAKRLLAEAGYPQGFKTNVVVASGSQEILDLLELTKGYFAAIGVDLEIKVMEPAAASSIVSARKHEAFAVTWTALNCQPRGCITYPYKGATVPWNQGNVDDPVFNGLVDKAAQTFDYQERMRLYQEANTYGTSQFWCIVFPVRHTFTLWQPWTGYQGEDFLGVSNYGALWARVWVDTGLKQKLTGQRD
jgi:peptide/nickel transport system substrate-binding protein